jgi:hypothetical protein
MPTPYTARIGTRITEAVNERLELTVLLERRQARAAQPRRRPKTASAIVDEALDAHLQPLDALRAQLGNGHASGGAH